MVAQSTLMTARDGSKCAVPWGKEERELLSGNTAASPLTHARPWVQNRNRDPISARRLAAQLQNQSG